MRKLAELNATRVWPIAVRDAASAVDAPPRLVRSVAMATSVTTPVRMVAASRVRRATYPIAKPSFCRRTTGKA